LRGTLQTPQAVVRVDGLVQALSLDMSDWWEPTAAGYFSRVTKDTILAAIEEGAGAEAAKHIKDVSKSELARVAERELQGKRWLPKPQRAARRIRRLTRPPGGALGRRPCGDFRCLVKSIQRTGRAAAAPGRSACASGSTGWRRASDPRRNSRAVRGGYAPDL